jgi:uncharacterized protein YecT (DUF1311 family)
MQKNINKLPNPALKFAPSGRWGAKMIRASTLMAFFFLACGSASAEQFSTILGECWEDHDHAHMSNCVEKRAAQARAHLGTVEKEIREAIAKSKEEPAYVKTVAAAFEASVKSFQNYRKDQCSFVFALASVGNGAEDNKKACEVQLDILRIEQLHTADWWLKQ